jgi:photosystem II stability/assembly factor-like uncharacterized protein
MKRAFPLLLLAVLAVSLSGPLPVAGGDADDDPGRGVLDRLTKRDRFYDVAVVGDDVWIVGFPGILLHSADRGRIWEEQGSGRDAFFAVDFINAQEGWIVGRGGLVLHTADGGANWSPQTGAAKEHLFDVDFVDSQHGWAVGNFGTLVRTGDGGKTWARVKIALSDDDDEGMDDDDGPGNDDDGMDDDEGMDDGYGSPEAVEGQEGEEQEEEEEPFDRLLNGVFFVDAKQGWIAGESGVMLHTTDGGDTWEEQDSGEWAPLYSLTFSNALSGYAAGSDGAVLKTEDGGETWTRLESGTKEHLFRVAVSSGKLFAVGRRGVLVSSATAAGSDGSLAPVPLGVYTWLDAIAVSDDGLGFIVGGQGLILRTDDHGRKWENLGK